MFFLIINARLVFYASFVVRNQQALSGPAVQPGVSLEQVLDYESALCGGTQNMCENSLVVRCNFVYLVLQPAGLVASERPQIELLKLQFLSEQLLVYRNFSKASTLMALTVYF